MALGLPDQKSCRNASSCCLFLSGLLVLHTVPVLLLCLGYLLPNADADTQLALRGAGWSVLVLTWVAVLCVRQ